jgi:hypothetical protein
MFLVLCEQNENWLNWLQREDRPNVTRFYSDIKTQYRFWDNI